MIVSWELMMIFHIGEIGCSKTGEYWDINWPSHVIKHGWEIPEVNGWFVTEELKDLKPQTEGEIVLDHVEFMSKERSCSWFNISKSFKIHLRC